jgi:hypothetical protein
MFAHIRFRREADMTQPPLAYRPIESQVGRRAKAS